MWLCLLKLPSEPKIERSDNEHRLAAVKRNRATSEIVRNRHPDMMEQASIRKCVGGAPHWLPQRQSMVSTISQAARRL